jgi:hypothetical protein
MTPDDRACYWKSGDGGGSLHYLSAGRGSVFGVCASGGRVYAAGFVGTGGNNHGMGWGGDGAVLHDLGPGTVAFAVAASEGHVYAAGTEGYNARVWRDGEVVLGVDEAVEGEEPIFHTVCVSGGVVYAAGDMGDVDGYIYRPFWTRQDDPRVRFFGAGEGKALSMQPSGDGIFISGYDGGGSGKVWRLTAAGALSQSFGTGVGWLNSVSVVGEDVYTGGNRGAWVDGGVWRNAAQVRSYGAGSSVQAVCAVPAP